MGSIRERSKGTYQIRVEYKTIDGKRKEASKTIKGTKREAQKALAELETKINKGEYFETEKMSLQEYLSYWLDTYAKVNVSASTLKRYKEFTNTINNNIGNIALNQLKPAHIQKFYSTLLTSGKLSNSTILKIHRALRMALKHAVGWQIMGSNPTDSVTAPRADKTEMQVWNKEQIKEFLFLIDKSKTMYMPILIALSTGMRAGEICALKWDCIDLNSGIISVRYTLKRENGTLVLRQPKTKKSVRTITLASDAVRALKEYRKIQLAIKFMMGKEYIDSNFVCAWNDGRPVDPHYLAQNFPKLVKKMNEEHCDKNSNIDETQKFEVIRFHDLRHTHATLLLMAGVAAKVVSERLGHSNISITMDTYSHVLPNMQKEAAEKLEGLI